MVRKRWTSPFSHFYVSAPELRFGRDAAISNGRLNDSSVTLIQNMKLHASFPCPDKNPKSQYFCQLLFQPLHQPHSRPVGDGLLITRTAPRVCMPVLLSLAITLRLREPGWRNIQDMAASYFFPLERHRLKLHTTYCCIHTYSCLSNLSSNPEIPVFQYHGTWTTAITVFWNAKLCRGRGGRCRDT